MANLIPPPKAAYVDVGGTWQALTSTDPAAAGPVFTPPPAGLYTFNTSLGQWVPWSGSSGGGGAPTGPAGGDLAGTYPNPTVHGVNGTTLPVSAASLATNAAGQIIAGTGGGGAPTGPAGGDLAGTYPNPNVAGSSIATTFSAQGAPSVPAMNITGTPSTAGTTTTDVPLVYLSPAGTTAPTTWNTNGTYLGFNGGSGFSGNFLDIHVNGGVTITSISSTGVITTTNFVATGVFSVGTGWQTTTVRTLMNNVFNYQWTNSSSTGGTVDTVLSRASAGTLQINNGTAAGSTGALRLGQILGGSATPTVTLGAGAGTAPTITLATGSSNLGGQISVTVGTGPAGANAAIVTINFSASSFANPAFVTLTPANAAAAALTGVTQIYVNSTATAFTLNSGTTALTAATQYVFNYSITGS